MNPTTLLPLLMLGLASGSNTIAGFLRQDGWPTPVNTILTWVLVAGAAVAYAFLSGTLVPNLPTDVTIITSAITLLLGGVLAPLSSWIQPRVLNIKKAPATLLNKRTVSVVPTVQTWNTGKQDTSG